jgi:hypothetical protein
MHEKSKSKRHKSTRRREQKIMLVPVHRKRKQPHRKRKEPQVSRATSREEKRDSTPEPYALIWWKIECRLWCMPPSWEELGVLLTYHVGSLTKSGYCSYYVVTF